MYEKCVKHYNLARLALLIMTVLTVVNIGWLIFDLDATSVFFAALPMMATRVFLHMMGDPPENMYLFFQRKDGALP